MSFEGITPEAIEGVKIITAAAGVTFIAALLDHARIALSKRHAPTSTGNRKHVDYDAKLRQWQKDHGIDPL
ncbi:hypothetical protein EPO56_00830 [Patescibacteria group bacterium]|nr:MAG: hypothetical protein EPO56_00830 [Patescibacteria group bacterium]